MIIKIDICFEYNFQALIKSEWQSRSIEFLIFNHLNLSLTTQNLPTSTTTTNYSKKLRFNPISRFSFLQLLRLPLNLRRHKSLNSLLLVNKRVIFYQLFMSHHTHCTMFCAQPSQITLYLLVTEFFYLHRFPVTTQFDVIPSNEISAELSIEIETSTEHNLTVNENPWFC